MYELAIALNVVLDTGPAVPIHVLGTENELADNVIASFKYPIAASATNL